MGKGQAEQVFIYILALLIFALVVGYGYSAIQGFLQQQERISLLSTKQELENAFRQALRSYGDVMVFDEKNPLRAEGLERICVVEGKKDSGGIPAKYSNEPLLADAWNSGGNLVFLIGEGIDSFSVTNITVQNPCFDVVNGKVMNLKLEGKGTSVLVSLP
ncbi:hypothetical protein HY491_03545 [Candidatus Woesearchaeota archaeon]|nr:hypothetical protein [Candidatus Woesearchaeota archaeon]